MHFAWSTFFAFKIVSMANSHTCIRTLEMQLGAQGWKALQFSFEEFKGRASGSFDCFSVQNML